MSHHLVLPHVLTLIELCTRHDARLRPRVGLWGRGLGKEGSREQRVIGKSDPESAKGGAVGETEAGMWSRNVIEFSVPNAQTVFEKCEMCSFSGNGTKNNSVLVLGML